MLDLSRFSWLVILAGTLTAFRLARPRLESITRGLRLLTPGQLNSKLNGWRLTYSGIRVGNIWVPHEMETEHFLVTGTTGIGKSTLGRQILRQLQTRGATVVIVDPESEFVQEFYNENRGDVLLNPLDSRCPRWSPKLEIKSQTDIEALAKSLIPQGETSFYGEARILLTGAFELYNEAKEICFFLSQANADIIEALKNNVTARSICDPRAINQFSAIKGIAASAAYALRFVPDKAEREWSAKNWDKKSWIFLAADERSRAAAAPLQSIWFNLIMRELLSQEINSAPIWVVADEISVLGYQPHLKDLLKRGRKRGLCGVIGCQNIAQIREIYGRDGAIDLLDQPATKITLRTSEPETAEWASSLVGEQEVKVGERLERKRLATTGEIQGLPKRRGYVLAGADRATIRIPHCWIIKHVPAFLPRMIETAQTTMKAPVEETLEWQRWYDIVQRCTNPSNLNWHNYGKRGIKICDTWLNYDNFITDLLDNIGACPGKEYSLDRINNNQGYEPGNVRWATAQEQARNRRRQKTNNEATLPLSTHG